jgi:hypothetical protein
MGKRSAGVKVQIWTGSSSVSFIGTFLGVLVNWSGTMKTLWYDTQINGKFVKKAQLPAHARFF